ncbi:MAG TPA: SDR family NAD(P)-dependent oxidoreductase, partial [Pyrinomonadaceae bacterium]|nr:SDR family NAD(P)-dependent oxidoreductase [Pyrinomonadaceae bacterium]
MSNPFDVTGKVALVTGASSGIGRAAARALAANGARVAVNFHRNQDGAEATRAEIVAAGGAAIAIKADVAQASEVQALVERTVNELGPIDILVNNAGSLIERLRILELTEERWD